MQFGCCAGDTIDYAAHAAANPAIVKAQQDQERLKQKLIVFFNKHDKNQIPTCSARAQANRLNEVAMWADLQKRYGDEKPPTKAPAPTQQKRSAPKAPAPTPAPYKKAPAPAPTGYGGSASMAKIYGDKIFKATFRCGQPLGFNVYTDTKGFTTVECIKSKGQAIEKCLQDQDQILKIGHHTLSSTTTHHDVVKMFKSMTGDKFEVKLKRRVPKDGAWYTARVIELNAFYKKHAAAKVGDGDNDFTTFGFLFLEKALVINYKEAPENWSSIRSMMEENRVVKYGDGPMGLNLEACDVIPGVQRGMRVRGVDPKGVSASLGVKPGDMLWGLNSEGFPDKMCTDTNSFANGLKSVTRPMHVRITSARAAPSAGSTI